MLTERIIVGRLEVLEDGLLQVREDTVIERDGVELIRTYHRRVLEPGEVVSREDARIRAVAAVVWTPEVIKAYEDKKRAQAAAFDTIKGAK